MLANGTILRYKTTGTSYTEIDELKEIPDFGINPEKVENSRLNVGIKNYEFGVGDPGDITYKLDYDNSVGSTYRAMRAAQAAKTVVSFQEETPDGTITDFSGYVSVKRTGGKLNDPLGVDLSIALQGEIEITDPS